MLECSMPTSTEHKHLKVSNRLSDEYLNATRLKNHLGQKCCSCRGITRRLCNHSECIHGFMYSLCTKEINDPANLVFII